MKTIKIVILLISTIAFSQESTIKKLEINNQLDHFSVFSREDKVYFTHNSLTKTGRATRDNSKAFVYTIFEGSIDENAQITNVSPIKKTKNGKFNMSAAIISKDGKFMYFTTNNTSLGENKARGEKTFNLQIQRAEFKEAVGWTNFTVLPFCDVDSNYAHPTLSPDENSLYFVSNLKGTKGKSDIYKVSVSNHSAYGEPEILNESINSPRTELFPFVSADNILYFSSNRRGGLGGFDIYSYDLSSTIKDQKAIALPAPINDIGEDFSFFLKDDLKTGYFTSRRNKGEGRDDVYYFEFK